MDIQYIMEFLSLAEGNSFGTTAENFGITLSALSKHIKQLESELGAPLLIRSSKQPRLNEFGELLLPYAKQLADAQLEFFTKINYSSIQESDTIRIGVPVTMQYYTIVDLITEFQNTYPEISVDLIEGETEMLRQRLKAGQISFAFVNELQLNCDDGFSRIPYSEDMLAAILPIDHPHARDNSVSLHELKDDDFLLLNENTIIYTLCMKLFQNAKITPKIIFKGTGESVFNGVDAGVGVSLLGKRPALSLLRSFTSVVDISPRVPTYINFLYQEMARPPIAYMKFLQFMKAKLQ